MIIFIIIIIKFCVCLCVSEHVECPVSGCSCRCMSLDTITTPAVTSGDAASVVSWCYCVIWCSVS